MKISSTMSRHAAKGIARGIEGRKEGWYPLPMIVHRAKTIEDLSHVSLPFATARIVTRSFLLPFLLSRSISLFNFHDRAIPGFIGKVHLFPTPPSSRLLCATRNTRGIVISLSASLPLLLLYIQRLEKKVSRKISGEFPSLEKASFQASDLVFNSSN